MSIVSDAAHAAAPAECKQQDLPPPRDPLLRSSFMSQFDTFRGDDAILNFAANFFGVQPNEPGYEAWQTAVADEPNVASLFVQLPLQAKLAAFQARLMERMAQMEKQATSELLEELSDEEILDWRRCIQRSHIDRVANSQDASMAALSSAQPDASVSASHASGQERTS